ncbi:hypothetical protein D3C81_1489240 [compost metagenome]
MERGQRGLQIRALDSGVAPCGQRAAGLGRVPHDLAQAAIEGAEENTSMFVVHESAEKLLVVFRAQLAGQFSDQVVGRGVFLERVLGIIGDISHHPCRVSRGVQVWGKHDDTGQRCAQHPHVMAQHRCPADVQAFHAVEHGIDQAKIAFRHIAVHPRPLQGGFHRGFLAVIDFVAQHGGHHRIGIAEVVFEMGLVSRADVQSSAQSGESGDAHFRLDRRQGTELAADGGTSDEGRVSFEGIVTGFRFLEVVQRGLQ